MKLMNRNLISNAALMAALFIGGQVQPLPRTPTTPWRSSGAPSRGLTTAHGANMRDSAEFRTMSGTTVLHMRIRAGLTGQEQGYPDLPPESQ